MSEEVVADDSRTFQRGYCIASVDPHLQSIIQGLEVIAAVAPTIERRTTILVK